MPGPNRGNLGSGMRPQAQMTDRGQHPDDHDGPVHKPGSDEDFDQRYWHDQQFREEYTREQQRYCDTYFPDEVRRDIYDADYSGMRPSQARRLQQQRVRESFETHGYVPPWGARAEYDKYFDDNGQVRAGLRKFRLEGDVDLDDTVDVTHPHHYPPGVGGAPRPPSPQPARSTDQVIDLTRPRSEQRY